MLNVGGTVIYSFNELPEENENYIENSRKYSKYMAAGKR